MTQKKQPARKKRGRMPRASISFPPETYRNLERLAENRKVSVAWLVRDAVDRYLASDFPLFQRAT
jgi:predicted DNA-binding protein